MPQAEPVKLAVTANFMREGIGADAYIAARSTLDYMHLISDVAEVKRWERVVAELSPDG